MLISADLSLKRINFCSLFCSVTDCLNSSIWSIQNISAFYSRGVWPLMKNCRKNRRIVSGSVRNPGVKSADFQIWRALIIFLKASKMAFRIGRSSMIMWSRTKLSCRMMLKTNLILFKNFAF